jgi:hypothetical protein
MKIVAIRCRHDRYIMMMIIVRVAMHRGRVATRCHIIRLESIQYTANCAFSSAYSIAYCSNNSSDRNQTTVGIHYRFMFIMRVTNLNGIASLHMIRSDSQYYTCLLSCFDSKLFRFPIEIVSKFA